MSWPIRSNGLDFRFHLLLCAGYCHGVLRRALWQAGQSANILRAGLAAGSSAPDHLLWSAAIFAATLRLWCRRWCCRAYGSSRCLTPLSSTLRIRCHAGALKQAHARPRHRGRRRPRQPTPARAQRSRSLAWSAAALHRAATIGMGVVIKAMGLTGELPSSPPSSFWRSTPTAPAYVLRRDHLVRTS